MTLRVSLKMVPILTLVWCAVAQSADGQKFEQTQTAMNALESAARPQEMRQARNGAIYAMLHNGCELIVLEKRSAPVIAVQGWMRTGAIHESKWMGAGLSHFCEHMLFKGTNKRPTGVLDQEIRGAGGDDNAYTTSDRTVYHVTSAADGFDVSFNALADMLMDSTFPPEETVKEHAVVVKEIERHLDNPDSVWWEAFERTIYQEHPYRVPVLGHPDRFKAVTRDEVFAYYQQRYSPELCTFVAVGDFDAAVVMPKMAKVLATWKRKSIEPVAIAVEPEQVAPRYVEITHPLCAVPKLGIAFPSVSMRNPDLYALDVLANVLGDGRASRLYRNVKDKGLALDISAYSHTPLYPGHFGIYATVEEDKLAGARAAVMQEFEEAKKKKVSDEELARAKRKVAAQHVYKQMTAAGVAEALGSDWFIAGDLDFSETYRDKIQEVTADDLLRVAKKYLVAQRVNVCVMLPEKHAAKPLEAAAQPSQKEFEAALAQSLQKIQADPAVEKATLLKDKAVFELTLKNGVRVVVREDHALPVLNASIAALGGTRWEPPELAGAGKLLAEMLDRGTKQHNLFAIATVVEDLGASLSTFSGRNSFGLNLTSLAPDAPALLDLAADCMLRSTFPDAELEKLKADTLQSIAQEDESLQIANSKVLRPLLYGNHPYARQASGTRETVQKVSADDLKKLHAAWVQPENLCISIAGDLAALDALELVKKNFGALKGGAFKAPAVAPLPALKDGVSGENQKENITGAVLTLGFPGVGLRSPDRETLDLIAAVLSGLGGRLNVSLREKQGLAYSVGVHNDSQLDGGAIVFFIQTDPQSIDKSLAGMWKEVELLRAEAVGQKELDSVKNYLAGSEAIELENQSDLAQRLALSQLYNEGAAEVFARPVRLKKITSEQLKAAAEKYLDPKRWARAVVKPK